MEGRTAPKWFWWNFFFSEKKCKNYITFLILQKVYLIATMLEMAHSTSYNLVFMSIKQIFIPPLRDFTFFFKVLFLVWANSDKYTNIDKIPRVWLLYNNFSSPHWLIPSYCSYLLLFYKLIFFFVIPFFNCVFYWFCPVIYHQNPSFYHPLRPISHICPVYIIKLPFWIFLTFILFA